MREVAFDEAAAMAAARACRAAACEHRRSADAVARAVTGADWTGPAQRDAVARTAEVVAALDREATRLEDDARAVEIAVLRARALADARERDRLRASSRFPGTPAAPVAWPQPVVPGGVAP